MALKPQRSCPVKTIRARPALSLTLSTLIAASGCATTDATFPVIVGASMTKSDVRPCSDYASYSSYTGNSYYIQNPESGKVIRRHEGIDFCTQSGAEVIAPANGTVVVVDPNNPYRGGRVTIRTHIEYRDNAVSHTLHLDMLHITPKSDLKVGDTVKAGQAIGYVEPPGKLEIGPQSHVHLSAGPTYMTWEVHTDPNRFWQKGPGVVSCFNPNNPPSDAQIVAPIGKC